MKKYFLSFLCLIFVLMLIFAISGCNADKQDISNTDNTTANTSAVTETTGVNVSEIEPSVNVSITTDLSTEVIPQTDATVSYTQEENELEIITVPIVKDNPTTDGVQNPAEKPTEILTEPQNPFTQNEPIELPFVPIN